MDRQDVQAWTRTHLACRETAQVSGYVLFREEMVMRIVIDLEERQMRALDSLSKSLDICHDSLIREAIRSFVQRNRQASNSYLSAGRSGDMDLPHSMKPEKLDG
jgi:hypothetical protein